MTSQQRPVPPGVSPRRVRRQGRVMEQGPWGGLGGRGAGRTEEASVRGAPVRAAGVSRKGGWDARS